jgi:hypothetical protein
MANSETVSFNSDLEPSRLTSSINCPKRAGMAKENAVDRSRAMVPRMRMPAALSMRRLQR